MTVRIVAQMFVTVEVADDGTAEVLVPEVAPGDLMDFACLAWVGEAEDALDLLAGEAYDNAEVTKALHDADAALASQLYVTIDRP